MKAAWYLNTDAIEAAAFPRGAFCLAVNGNGETCSLIAVCVGCGGLSALTCSRDGKPPGDKTWHLTGTDDAPTLSPSVHHVGCWHGWLRDGEWSAA